MSRWCNINWRAWFDLVFHSLAPCSIAASSTTGPDHLKQDKEGSANDASSWSVDDVIRFVQEADPQTLGPHIELFRKHVSISFIWTVFFVLFKGQPQTIGAGLGINFNQTIPAIDYVMYLGKKISMVFVTANYGKTMAIKLLYDDVTDWSETWMRISTPRVSCWLF